MPTIYLNKDLIVLFRHFLGTHPSPGLGNPLYPGFEKMDNFWYGVRRRQPGGASLPGVKVSGHKNQNFESSQNGFAYSGKS